LALLAALIIASPASSPLRLACFSATLPFVTPHLLVLYSPRIFAIFALACGVPIDVVARDPAVAACGSRSGLRER
jgi:hypothetical protein